jgi:hypothetical protein
VDLRGIALPVIEPLIITGAGETDQPPRAGCHLLQQLIGNFEFFALQEGYAPFLIGDASSCPSFGASPLKTV